MPIIWLAKAALLSYKDPEEFTRKFNELPEKSKLIASKVNNYVCENPLESLTNAVAFITEFILINKIPTSQSLAIRPLCKISRILKEEQNIAKNIKDPNLRKAATPVTQIIKQTKKVAKTAATKGVKNTKSALQTLRENMYLIQKGEKPTLLLEALAEFKEVFPNGRVNWRHVFRRGFNKRKGRPEGFHFKASAPESIVKVIKGPDKHGVYMATYEYLGKRKISTFFPDQWPHKKVIQKIKEAYKNPIKSVKGNEFIGRTEEGIMIQFWFEKDMKTGKIILNSIYPYLG